MIEDWNNMTVKESPVFEYYVTRVRSFEQATRWVKTYSELYQKYIQVGSDVQKFAKIKRKGQKALDRLLTLL